MPKDEFSKMIEKAQVIQRSGVSVINYPKLKDPNLWLQAALKWQEQLKDPSLNPAWIGGLADMCNETAMKLLKDPEFDVVTFVCKEQGLLHKKAFGR